MCGTGGWTGGPCDVPHRSPVWNKDLVPLLPSTSTQPSAVSALRGLPAPFPCWPQAAIIDLRVLFFLIFKYLVFIYLAAWGLRCGMQTPSCGMPVGSSSPTRD